MTFFQSAIMGFIQGITEFLPISSSGHIDILKESFGIDNRYLEFDIILHLASLLAVFIYFRQDIRKQLIKENFLSTKNLKFMRILVVAFLPVAISGPIFDYYFSDILSSYLVTIFGFLITGLILISVESLKFFSMSSNLGYRTSLLIGLIQVIALIPGFSRSGLVISTAMFLGVDKNIAARFSVFLGAITILGSSLYLTLKSSAGISLTLDFRLLICGGFFAFFSSILSIEILIRVVKNSKLWVFGIYCIGISLVSLVFYF